MENKKAQKVLFGKGEMRMAHNVICPKCGIKFDRDKIQAVKISARRYGHATCYRDNKDFVECPNLESNDLIQLNEYIYSLFGENTNWALVKQQIKKYQKQGYSLTGIKKALVYFYDVKHNSKEKANNAIGIVPFCYQDAYNYYYSLFLAQQATQDKTLITKVKEIIIKPPKMRGTKQQFFDLGEWEDEE